MGRRVSITGRPYGTSGAVTPPKLPSAAPADNLAAPAARQESPRRSSALVETVDLVSTSQGNLRVLLEEIDEIRALAGEALAQNTYGRLSVLSDRLWSAEHILDQAVAELATLVGAVPNPQVGS
jgi:hypothetical protein